VTFQIGFNAGALSTSLDLNIAGPGEVSSLDPRAVIRRVPEQDVHDAEPNYFPLLEVSIPELPWTYTPAKATNDERLTPWCTLICLAASETAEYRPAGVDGQLAVVRVTDSSVLPKWDQLWAWAHVQLSGDKSAAPGELAQILEQEPQRVIARFLCPRRLDSSTSYRAFLVPSFERGRLAGLRHEIAATVDGLTPAWDATSQDLELPILYEWRFQTGIAEDFEYLVRQLKPYNVPEEVGRRDMDVLDPGLGLPAAASYPLALEGALKTVSTKSTIWDAADQQAFVPKLAGVLNLPDNALTNNLGIPVVAPPLYGRWHALQRRLIDTATALPKWFHQLNRDPRLRVSAALGTWVIQQEQRQLMASAWEQVGPIREINEERRKKQLAMMAAQRIYERHWKTLDSESMLMSAGPVLSRIQASPRTVLASLRASPISPAMLDPQFKRIGRPLGPIGRRQGRLQLHRPPTLLTRINTGELMSRIQPPNPVGIVTSRSAGVGLGDLPVSSVIMLLIKHAAWWALLLAVLSLILFFIGVPILVLLALIAAAFIAFYVLRKRVADADRRTALVAGTLSGNQVLAAPGRADFLPTATPFVGAPPPAAARVAPRTAGQAQSVELFRMAAAKALDQARKPPQQAPDLVSLNLLVTSKKVITALDPKVTIAAGIKERVKTRLGAVQPDDPLQEVMAAPDFPQPMYEPLRDLGQDWLLPGLEKVPANSICLLETNQQFVESYMLGLSHEMARELLWNEYPTDQRGTYFRQFWDVRGYVPPAGVTINKEKLKDITPIHTWHQNEQLGANSSRQTPSGGSQLVLLIRGDLLRRYPNTIIYAVRAIRGNDGKRTLGTEELHPMFRGTLKPDVTFFGFDLTYSQARGSTRGDGDLGWFFVLQEQPAEPRFGLDLPNAYGTVPATWNDLAWSSLAADEAALKAIKYIDLSAALPNTGPLENNPNGPVWHVAGMARSSRSSDLAYITLQMPVRVGIHAGDMLPPASGAGP
jgi:hypothetical protein